MASPVGRFQMKTATFNVASSITDPNLDFNTGSAQFYIASPPLPTPTPGPANDAQLAYFNFDVSTNQSDIFKRRAISR